MKKWVYLFDEGDPNDRALLGGKGAGLAQMTQAGLPVPQDLLSPQRLVTPIMSIINSSQKECGNRC